jgi:molybdate transport system ATP-binding protein
MENDIIEINLQKELISAHGRMTLSIDTTLKIGQFNVLFGVSGAGKTTLLRLMAGLINPDKGYIRFGNQVWCDTDTKVFVSPQKRNVGYVFQDYALFPNMSVLENVAFGIRDKNKHYAHELIERFKLSEFANRKPAKLSGGQKQRVALARALACKPSLLLLDEPLSALDTAMRHNLQTEIAEAHKMSGTTSIMVSHDLNEVFRLAQHVIYIDNGKVIRNGTPETVFTDDSISGKVQITGIIARIEKQDTVNLITVIVGGTQIIKVIAFESDMENLNLGDSVMVYTKAFNPIISKLG